MCVCVCVRERERERERERGVKGAEARNYLITYSININSAWGFTFILIYVFGVWYSNKRQKITFYPVFIIDNYFSRETLRFKLKKICYEHLKEFKLCILYSEVLQFHIIVQVNKCRSVVKLNTDNVGFRH